jgi:hypothetical protein
MKQVFALIFTFVHPILLVSLALFGVALYCFQGKHGPSAEPLILIFAPIQLGILIGIVLSLVRIIRYVFRRG